MNRIHRTVFNRRLGLVQVVAETACNRGKSGRSGTGASTAAIAVAGLLFLASLTVHAADLPTGGTIAAGSGAITTTRPASMQIQQNSDKLVINWQSFDIGKDASVRFLQPSSSSIALNRVLGSDGSSILGRLDANGRVFLVNPNGILFGKDAQVSVGGLVASTLNISDSDFLAGNYRFSGSGGSVVNQGAITAADGGSVALLGGKVSNEGTISARLGTVALAAGKTITLDFAGDGLIKVEIDEGLKNALVENHQLIVADGGQVLLTAKAADALLETLVNNTGIIQARTLGEKEGKIVLLGGFDGGTVQVAGTLDASAPGGGNGGFIETSGAHVKIADGTVVTTKAADGTSGTWRVDPATFTIGAGGDVSGATVQTALANNGQFIASASAGDVNVNDAINWSSGTLKLYASNDVNINKVLTATGNASFEASYGRMLDGSGLPTLTLTNGTGKDADGVPYGLYTENGLSNFIGRIDFSGNGTVTLNGATATVINDAASLAALSGNSGNYVLGANLTDLTQQITGFSGSLNGFGHTLAFTNTSTSQVGGLFNTLNSGTVISNVGISGSIKGGGSATTVGALANVNAGSIINSFSSANISSLSTSGTTTVTADSIGGLVGTNSGLIAQSYAYGIVYAYKVAGGLVGINDVGGRIIDSSSRLIDTTTTAAATVNGTSSSSAAKTTLTYLGGLVGINRGDILRSWTKTYINLSTSKTVSTSVPNFMGGGFVGLNTGTINESYAYVDTSDVTSGGNGGVATAQYMDRMGGFVGDNQGTINNAYAYNTMAGNTGNTTTGFRGAGFAYKNSGTIRNSYARWGTDIAGPAQAYGFVYNNTGGTLENVYWSYLSFSGVGSKAPIGIGITRNGTTNTAATDTLPSFGNTAAAATLSNYTGFDSSIWGSAVSGYPMLKSLGTLYIGNRNTALVYGDSLLNTNSNSTSVLVAGLQAGDTRASILTVDPNELANGNGYIDAGTYAADQVLDFSTAAATANVYKMQGSVTVTPKQLTLAQTGVVADKVYDGTTDATLINTSTAGLTGLVGSQTLNVAYTASFSTKNVVIDGIGGLVGVTLVYTSASDGANGGKASNYILPGANSPTYAHITARPLNTSVLDAGASGKTYDGTTAASVTPTTTDAVALADMANGLLGLGYASAVFGNANAGTGKTVTLSGLSLTGSDAANYTLGTTTLTGTADIAPRVVGVYGSRSGSGTTQVNLNELILGNVLAGDAVHLSGAATLANTNTGSQSLGLGGLNLDNPNYTLVGAVGAFTIGDFIRTAVSHSSGVSFDSANDPLVITTTSDKSVINWQNFSVGAGETVQFVQPHSYSIVLNRVVGNAESLIAGTLSSNGRVFILNPNGVLFTLGASVNVGALVASTLAMSDSDFNNSHYVFTASGGSGSVVNQGDIVIVDGGFLALASGGGVTATGNETVHGGKAVLASANSLTLDLNPADSGLAGYAVSNLSGNTTVNGNVNVSAASGNGGLVETAGNSLAVNAAALNTGTNGTWSLTLPSITIGSQGNYSAAFVQGQLAARNLLLNAKTGDLTINDGIAWSSDRSLGLSAGGTNRINARIAASGTNAGLALNGAYLIDSARLDYDGNPTGHAGAGITLSGANGHFSVDGNAYTLLHSMADFAGLDGTGHYALAQGVDASGTSYAGAVISTLSGTLAGLGNVIDHLTIDAGLGSNVGLVGQATTGSVIRDIGLSNANVRGHEKVGTLLGSGTGVSIDNAWASGTLTGTANDSSSSNDSSSQIGGLVGYLKDSTVAYSHADVAVTSAASTHGGGTAYVSGGLVGDMTNTNIHDAYATGNVIGNYYTGGLVGHMLSGNLANSWASGQVTGILATPGVFEAPGSENQAQYVGGLVGWVENSNGGSATITHVRASGDVAGGQFVGGLIGRMDRSVTVSDAHAAGNISVISDNSVLTHNYARSIGGLVGSSEGVITDSSASGDVTAQVEGNATGSVGGLVGSNGGSIINSSATGAVHGDRRVGGLVGSNNGLIRNSHASGNVWSTVATAGGLAGENLGSGVIDGSWASGHVTGWNNLGGLVGDNIGGLIQNSQAHGDVTSTATGIYGQRGSYVGGLAGTNSGTIDGSTASGDVTGGDRVGALVGANGGTITRSTASGNLDAGTWETGGLVGQNTGSVDAESRWNNPAANGNGGTGTTTPNEDRTTRQTKAITTTTAAVQATRETFQRPDAASANPVIAGNSIGLLNLLSTRNHGGEDGANFNADVLRIQVNGVTYELQNEPAAGSGGAGKGGGKECEGPNCRAPQ